MSLVLSTILSLFASSTPSDASASINDYLEKKIDYDVLEKRLSGFGSDHSQILKEFKAREIATVLVRTSPIDQVAMQLLSDGVDLKEFSPEFIQAKALDEFTDKILKSSADFTSYKCPSPVMSSSAEPVYVREDVVFGMRVAGCEEDVQKVKIKGDGHCMFRSYGFKLLEQLENKPEARGEVLLRFHDFINLINTPDYEFVREVIPNFNEQMGFLFDRIASGAGAIDVLNDPELSDAMVQSLRVLACASNLINPEFNYIDEDGRFDHEYEYYQAMMQMEERLWGGEEEANAISRVLGVRNFVFNFSSNRVSVQAPQQQIPTAVNICFYFKPGHYDALNISDVACQEIITREALDQAFLPQANT